LTYHWNDNIRDPTAFRFLNKFLQLRDLQLDFPVFIFEIHDKYGTRNRNRTCRDEESFGRFRVLNGLDQLLEIRDIQKVTINLVGTKFPFGEEKKIRDAAASLEAYLMKTLTMPMPLPKPVSSATLAQLAQDAQVAEANSYLQMLNAEWLQNKVAKGGAKAKGKGKARIPDFLEMSDDEDSEEESDEEVYIPRKTRSRASRVIADSSSEIGGQN
jgi:hypothetical protein